jgi:cytochrome c556
MNLKLRAAAAAILLACLVAGNANASNSAPPTKKHSTAKKVSKPAHVTIQNQIDQLNSALAAKDEQLKKVAQVAADSQAVNAKAEAVAQAQQQAASENASSVSALQSAVTDLKAKQTSLASTVSDETAKIRKSIDNPVVLRYKGITLTPTGFFNGESVYRTHATGGEMPTPWSSIPFEHADAYSMSEMYLSGRQSRIGLTMEGKTGWGTMRATLEGDFFGVGTTSNDNQSTSYVYRQRIAQAELETNSHWTISGGQGWSLATENKTGITTAANNMALPMMIDPNYVTGLVWARMGVFRLTKSFKKASFAVSAENPQLLYTATLAGNTPYAVVGSAGLSASLMNQTISSCSPSNTIVNYTNVVEKDANGITVNSPSAVTKLVNSCANLANISFNKAPDIVIKAAFDPHFGHFEVFGIGRTFHETVYPGETTNSNLYGGNKDIVTGLVVAPALTAAGSYSNSVFFGGIGGSMRVQVIPNKFTLGAKGLFGPGVGHFGASTLSDATSNANGELVPIHNVSAIFTAEANPTPRLTLYTYYGGDYAGRADYGSATTTTLAGPTAAQSAAGLWGGTWKAPAAAAVGYGSRLLSNSACNTTTAPGINGSSTGYYTGASCGAQTRDTQEITGGYWYDFYKGDRGRLRQGIQYGYSVREAWSGASGIGAKGTENMVFTSFRYFLP